MDSDKQGLHSGVQGKGPMSGQYRGYTKNLSVTANQKRKGLLQSFMLNTVCGLHKLCNSVTRQFQIPTTPQKKPQGKFSYTQENRQNSTTSPSVQVHQPNPRVPPPTGRANVAFRTDTYRKQ